MATSWSTTDKNPNVTVISARELTVPTGSGGWYGCRTTTSKTSGKYYLEFNIEADSSGIGVILGVNNASGTISNYPGSSGDPSVGYWDNGGQWLTSGTKSGSNTGSPGTTNTICMLVDLDGKTASAWLNGNTATKATTTIVFAGPYYIIASFSTGPGQDILASWQASDLKYAIPNGCSAWDAADTTGGIIVPRRRPLLLIAS